MMGVILGTPEGREGIWLVTKDVAIELLKQHKGKVHNLLGTAFICGADWKKQEAVKFAKEGEYRWALIFSPQSTQHHQLVAINDEQRWAFDIGEIKEERMVKAKAKKKASKA